MKLVFDTNIYIAAAVQGGFCNYLVKLVLARNSQYTLCISEPIMNELRSKLEIFLAKGLVTETNRLLLLNTIYPAAHIVAPKEKIQVIARDPDDNKILECATAAQADLIVTMDKDLLKLKRFRSIGIIHPKTFGYMLPKG